MLLRKPTKHWKVGLFYRRDQGVDRRNIGSEEKSLSNVGLFCYFVGKLFVHICLKTATRNFNKYDEYKIMRHHMLMYWLTLSNGNVSIVSCNSDHDLGHEWLLSCATKKNDIRNHLWRMTYWVSRNDNTTDWLNFVHLTSTVLSDGYTEYLKPGR